jgi:hypothetical protein
MTTAVSGMGRLCNQIIRNIAVSLIAEKNNLYAEYSSPELLKKLGIRLFVGNKMFYTQRLLDDSNYMEIYNTEKIKDNLIGIWSYFQTEEITDMIKEYLNKDEIKRNVIEKNPYKDRYKTNKDIFIHIRLTDVAKYNPGVEYYKNCINGIEYENLFIGTDDKNHEIIKEIEREHKNVKIVEGDEIDTIQFGSTCKYIILSHGTFSAVIGYLGYESEVYYNDKEPIWCPKGLFTNKGWKGIK